MTIYINFTGIDDVGQIILIALNLLTLIQLIRKSKRHSKRKKK